MEGIVVRRVIPSDNSCLFNAVGYAAQYPHILKSTRNKYSTVLTDFFLGIITGMSWTMIKPKLLS